MLTGLSATLGFLRAAAKHVVFISDAPMLASSAPSCVSAHLFDAYQCATDRSAAVLLPAVKAEEVALLTRQHVSWIDPTSWFCTAMACPAIVGNILVYRDNAHTVTALFNLTPPLRSRFTPAITAGGSFFTSSGSRPSTYYQPVAKLRLPISRHLSWFAEWRYYGYGEAFYLYEGFRTHLVTTGLRLTL